MKTVLHVGCGPKGIELPPQFSSYKEIRLDCDPGVEPDILASILAMPMIPDGSHDAVFASHIIEHLYFHEVALAVAECQRVLKPGGALHIRTPDLQSVCGRIAMDNPEGIVYQSGLGPITPMDMIYGLRSMVAAGNVFMAHKCGFTKSSLQSALSRAGFSAVDVERTQFELKAKATKPE